MCVVTIKWIKIVTTDSPVKIIADENIPLVAHYFGHCGEIIQKPGRLISRSDVADADILLVRSVTDIQATLLQQTPVRFVGTPISGLDHMDIDWLNQQGIRWANASTCNADAVVEYIICVIAALQKSGLLPTHHLRAGVIGVGKIGTRMIEKLKLLNFEIVQCDPFRAEAESDFDSTPLNEFADLDLITTHTPLTCGGKYPTFHLLDNNFFKQQKPGCFLLNVSRGAVIDSNALKQDGQQFNWCLDVWEHEPNLDQAILNKALIATPHIAGYSLQSKYRGIEMVYQQAVEMEIISPSPLTIPDYPTQTISFSDEPITWQDVVLKIFNPMSYTDYVKTTLFAAKENFADAFDQLRKEFTQRQEFQYIKIENAHLNDADKAMVQALGIVVT